MIDPDLIAVGWKAIGGTEPPSPKQAAALARFAGAVVAEMERRRRAKENAMPDLIGNLCAGLGTPDRPLSKSALAKRLGVSRQTLHRWLAGAFSPSPFAHERLVRLAAEVAQEQKGAQP